MIECKYSDKKMKVSQTNVWNSFRCFRVRAKYGEKKASLRVIQFHSRGSSALQCPPLRSNFFVCQLIIIPIFHYTTLVIICSDLFWKYFLHFLKTENNCRIKREIIPSAFRSRLADLLTVYTYDFCARACDVS